jgi:hypothetical protein
VEVEETEARPLLAIAPSCLMEKFRMSTQPTEAYASIMNGFNMIMAHLLREMDARGAISKRDFASQIESAIAGQPLQEPDGRIRFDRMMIQNLVHLLRGPTNEPGWKPELIQGGLSDPSEPEDSGS